MKYDFDKVIERRGTNSEKWDVSKNELPMWVADMDFALPSEILSDIKKRVDHGIFGYTDPDQNYRKALHDWLLKRHGLDIKDEWNTITPGIVYSIATAIRAVTGEGDSVLIQEPVYYPFKETIELNKRKCVNNQLLYRDGHYEIDFDDFEKKIIENNVRLFLLCSPHNPVGRVWSPEELRRLGEICNRHRVIIFADEIHSDFVYKGHKHISFLALGDEYSNNTILGTSPSKTFNMAGLQIANVIIPNESIRQKFRHENDANGYSQGATLGMIAAVACYTKGEKWLEELKEYLEGNISFIRDYLKENIPEVRLIEPEGTYLIWLDFSELTDKRSELKKLIVDRAGLWLDAGAIFGKETALFERINIACPRATIRKAFDQLNRAVKEYKDEINK